MKTRMFILFVLVGLCLNPSACVLGLEDVSDPAVMAFWPMDDPMYPQATLTDAGPHQLDLTLFKGKMITGRFGGALGVRADGGHSVYYAGYPGNYFDLMRMPDGEPTGLLGPTLPPTTMLERLAVGPWSVELWIRIDKMPAGPYTILDMGDALSPGFSIGADTSSGSVCLTNSYSGLQARISTELAALVDGRWHHLAISYPSGAQARPVLHVDGRLQVQAEVKIIPRQPLPPPAVWPADLSRPDPILCKGFTRKSDQAWRQRHRFNLSLGSTRTNTEGFDGALDEIRITGKDRMAVDFVPPGSFTRNYGLNPPRPSVPAGPPLLFINKTSGSVVDLGSRRHLFIDQALLEQSENLVLTCHPPCDRQTAKVEMSEDRDWRPCVLDVDGKVWLIIPEGYNSKRGRVRLRVSDDGLTFRKPDADLTGGRTLTDGDAVLTNSPLYGNVFEDTNPAVEPGDRYKLAAWVANRGIYMYTSPDAVNWRRNESCMLPLCSGGEAETYWDDQQSRYVSVLKRDSSCNHPDVPYGHGGRRGVQFYTNEILKPWPFRALNNPYYEIWPFPAVTGEGDLIFDTNKNGEVYRTRVMKYPWAPDCYLTFIWRFAKDSQTRRIDLGVSRDGENWTYFADKTWYMEPGQEEDEVLSIYGLIRRSDEIWQYFDFGGAHGGGDKPRQYARFRQRLDGFVSLDAPAGGGSFVTRPLRFVGDRLAINIATGAAGSARVALLDADGRPLKGYLLEECDQIKTDAINHIVSWRGSSNLTALAGQTIRVRIEMRDAQLYAMQFVQETSKENGPALKVWTAPAAQKVFREDDRPDDPASEIILEAAGNETESAQVVLRASGQDGLLTGATLAAFTSSSGAAAVSIRTSLMQVEYVYLPDFNRAWPDPLPPLKCPLALRNGLTQPLWLSVDVPQSTPAGEYHSTLLLTFKEGTSRTVPIRLRVQGFNLPACPSIRTAIGNEGDFYLLQHGAMEGTPQAAQLKRNYYQFFLERRISCYWLPCDLFDPEAAKWLNDPRLTSFVIPYSEDDAVLRRTIEHLKKNNWLDKGFFYIWDEPVDPADFEAIRRRALQIQAIEPRARINVPFNNNPREKSGQSTYERMDGLVNMWCPMSTALDEKAQALRAARGDDSWWYVCCAPKHPHANLMVHWAGAAHRVLFWQQKQRGINGFLYWSAVYWDPKFTRDPWTNIRTYEFHGGAYGDGSLVYPGDRVGINGPVTSIRLELLRDGIDDFDYLMLFEKLRGKEATKALIARATTDLDTYTTDPMLLDALRREMAEAIAGK